jgi:hypothetical protein
MPLHARSKLVEAISAILLALSMIPSSVASQEILQAQVLDLTVLEVQVIVTGALPSDDIQCLLRDGAGRVRVVGVQPLVAGTVAGSTTVVSVNLPLLAPTEREFAVSLVRADRELDRTPWRPLFTRP